MDKLAERLKVYIDTHPIDLDDSDCETVLDQLYQAYTESHESDQPEIRDSFKELDELLGALPLDDNNSVFIHRICLLFVFWKERNTAALSMAEETRDSCKLTVNIIFFSFP